MRRSLLRNKLAEIFSVLTSMSSCRNSSHNIHMVSSNYQPGLSHRRWFIHLNLGQKWLSICRNAWLSSRRKHAMKSSSTFVQESSEFFMLRRYTKYQHTHQVPQIDSFPSICKEIFHNVLWMSLGEVSPTVRRAQEQFVVWKLLVIKKSLNR